MSKKNEQAILLLWLYLIFFQSKANRFVRKHRVQIYIFSNTKIYIRSGSVRHKQINCLVKKDDAKWWDICSKSNLKKKSL